MVAVRLHLVIKLFSLGHISPRDIRGRGQLSTADLVFFKITSPISDMPEKSVGVALDLIFKLKIGLNHPRRPDLGIWGDRLRSFDPGRSWHYTRLFFCNLMVIPPVFLKDDTIQIHCILSSVCFGQD